LEKYGIVERPAGERARDRLSHVLFTETSRDQNEIWLDLTGVSEKHWHEDPFSASSWGVFGKQYGALDHPVRVAPMAHHVMGGVCIDVHGATTVPGLFAAGEVTGGLHGANRLGGNALTETQVFGARAGAAAAEWVRRNATVSHEMVRKKLSVSPFGPKTDTAASEVSRIKTQLRGVMWEKGGIIRSREGLFQALKAIEEIRTESLGLPEPDDPLTLQRILELRFAARVGALMLAAAMRREESRGAHFREDFPEPDDENWLGHLRIQSSPSSDEESSLAFDFRAVS